MKGVCKRRSQDLLIGAQPSDRPRGPGHKLKHTKCGLSEYLKQYFAVRVTLQWLPREIMDFSCVEMFKSSVATAAGCTWPCLGKGLDSMTSRSPFQPQCLCILYTFRCKINLLYDRLKANACKAIIYIFCGMSINFQTNNKKDFSASKSLNKYFMNSLFNLSSVRR